MPRRRATSFSSSHRASSRRLIAASRLNGPPAVCKGRPCTLARAGVRGGQGRPAMIKTILVALDGSEHADAALQYALWLAERVRATVLGLHVIDVVSIEGSFSHDISGSLGFEPYLDFSSKMREVLEERGRAMLAEFGERAAEVKVRTETVMDVGVIANEICERARTADVVVIGHRGINEKFSTGLLGGTAESVTRKCPKPLLVCPMEWRG